MCHPYFESATALSDIIAVNVVGGCKGSDVCIIIDS